MRQLAGSAGEFPFRRLADNGLCGGASLQVIPEGAGPVKTSGCVCFCLFWSSLVLVGCVEVGVGVKARAEPDRVAAVGP